MVQNILAELAVLQRERPYEVRSCVMAFPPGFVPSQEFLDLLYGTFKACPWLQTRRLSISTSTSSPWKTSPCRLRSIPDNVVLPAEAGNGAEQRRGFHRRHPIRSCPAGQLATLAAHRGKLPLHQRKRRRGGAGLSGQHRIHRHGETSGVTIEQKRSVTLSSTEGK